MESANLESPDIFESEFVYLPKASIYGEVRRLAGESELSEHQYQVARELLEPKVASSPEDFRLHVALGEVMVGLGDKVAALSSTTRAIDLLSANPLAPRNIRPHLITRVLAPAGLTDAAIEQLDAYFTEPGDWSIEGLLPDPRLDTIREDPRFEALVEKYRRQ